MEVQNINHWTGLPGSPRLFLKYCQNWESKLRHISTLIRLWRKPGRINGNEKNQLYGVRQGILLSFSIVLLWLREALWTLQIITGPTDNGPWKVSSQPSGKTQARGQNSGNPGWVEAEWWRDKCSWSTKEVKHLTCWSQLPWNRGRHYFCWEWGRPCQVTGPQAWLLGFLFLGLQPATSRHSCLIWAALRLRSTASNFCPQTT